MTSALPLGPACAGAIAYPARNVGSDIVVSVGYERRSIHELVDLLRDHDIGVLLDVREVAFSHRPEYRKGALQRALEDAGIRYVHLPVAGNPYRDQKDNLARCLAEYRRHLKRTPDVLVVVRGAIAAAGAVAMLCYERAHERCHRSVLLEALSAATSLKVISVE